MIYNKYFLTGVLFLLFTSTLIAQTSRKDSTATKTVPIRQNVNVKELTNNYVVKYNFREGLYRTNKIKPKVDNPVVYRIDSINRYAYKIEVEIKDSILAYSYSLSDLPDIVKKKDPEQEDQGTQVKVSKPVTIKESDFLQSEAAIKTDNKLKILVRAMNDALQVPALNEEIKNNGEKAKSLVNEIDRIKPVLLTLADSLIDSSKHLINDNKEIPNPHKIKDINEYNKIAAAIDEIEKNEKRIGDTLARINKNNTSAILQYNNDMTTLQQLFSLIRAKHKSVSKLNRYNNYLYEILHDHQLHSKDQFESKYLAKCTAMENEFDSLKTDISEYKTYYHDFILHYEKLKRNYQLNSMLKEAGTDKLYEFADNLKERVEKMYAVINLDQSYKDLDVMTRVISSLRNEDTYYWVSAPFIPTGDVVRFNVDIKKKVSSENKISNERKFIHAESTYGGIRFDFGVGLAASYFDNTPTYEIVTEDVGTEVIEGQTVTTSVSKIKQSSNELTAPALVGMATLSHRSSHYITFGGSAGLGIDVVSGKIQLSNFFVGPSIIFGRSERLALTFGASFRNVGELQAGIEEGQVVNEASKGAATYINDKYKIGAFMALTFNLTKGIKQNIKGLRSLM